MRLKGFEAIEWAEKEGRTLRKTGDDIDPPAGELSIAEAEAIAAEDPDLIYLDVPDDVYYGQPINMEPDR